MPLCVFQIIEPGIEWNCNKSTKFTLTYIHGCQKSSGSFSSMGLCEETLECTSWKVCTVYWFSFIPYSWCLWNFFHVNERKVLAFTNFLFFNYQRFPLGSFGIRNIIVGTVTQFSSTEELNEVSIIYNSERIVFYRYSFSISSFNLKVKDFFRSVAEQVSQLRVTQVATENVEKNILWLTRNLETMRSWLKKRLN